MTALTIGHTEHAIMNLSSVTVNPWMWGELLRRGPVLLIDVVDDPAFRLAAFVFPCDCPTQ